MAAFEALALAAVAAADAEAAAAAAAVLRQQRSPQVAVEAAQDGGACSAA